MRDFDAWLAGFRPAIAGYKYYTDDNLRRVSVDSLNVRVKAISGDTQVYSYSHSKA